MKYSSFVFVTWLLCGSISMFACNYERPQVNSTGGEGGSATNTSSSSGEGGSAGQGGSNLCTPGNVAACHDYNGPPATQNEGPCKASIRTCSPESSWGECAAEVLPVPEDCQVQVDTNCDGITGCTGAVRGSHGATGLQTDRSESISAVATGTGRNGYDGDVYAGGARNAGATNEARALLWHRNGTGVIDDWSPRFQFTNPEAVNGVVVTAVAVLPTSGDLIVTGVFAGGTLQIGSTPAMTTPSTLVNSFIARFTPTGTVVKVLQLGGPGAAINTQALTLDSSENICIGGNYVGSPSIATTALPLTSTAKPDGFVACLSNVFDYRWHHVITGIETQGVGAIAAVDGTDHLVIGSTFTGMTSFMTENQVNTIDAGTDPDMMVRRISRSSGKSVWSKQFIGTGTNTKVEVTGLAIHGSTVTVATRFNGRVQLESLDYMNDEASVETVDSFLANLSLDDGAIVNNTAIQAYGTQEIRAMAVDSFGSIVIAGIYSGAFSTNGMMLPIANAYDGFVGKFTPDFKVMWLQPLGNNGSQAAQAVDIGKSTGHIFVGGAFDTELTVINPPTIPVGSFDAFLLELAN